MSLSDPTYLDDHIFGDLDKPSTAFLWLHDRFLGVRHHVQKSPLNPGPGEKVTLTVTTSIDQSFEDVDLWWTSDDWHTQHKMNFEKHQIIWSTAIWSYLQVWKVTLALQPEGTMLRYKIGAKQQGQNRYVFADNQTTSFEDATNYSIWYCETKPPQWSADAVIYQIFVDRFYSGQNNPWQEKTDLRQPFGGTLKGVVEKLEYIKDLGFNTIWLTPIFESPSHHGYDISDYFKINPRMGSLSDLRNLLDRAHALGIRVILDFVANHCSDKHPFFQNAISDPKSEYRDWFIWKTWPNYESFFNVKSMPKLNLAYSHPARRYLLDCAKYWLSMGVDGFRLDYAHGPEQDFWVDFHKACYEINPDYWSFGEVIQPADVQASYTDGMGGTLDFLLSQAIRLTLGQEKWPLSKFVSFINVHHDYFSENFRLPSFIDNHDMNRFLFAANNDKRKLKLALLVLYLLPGPPIVYYGTEVPLSQNRSIHSPKAQGFDEARLAMPWHQVNSLEISKYLKSLSVLRKNKPHLSQTSWQIIYCDDENRTLLLGKADPNNDFLLINLSEYDAVFTLPKTESTQFLDFLENKIIDFDLEQHQIRVEPVTARLVSLI
jgi:glycosidase